MDRVLIVGAGTFQLPLIQRVAQECEVFVAAPVIDSRFDEYVSGQLLVDVRDMKSILQFAKAIGISGVMTDQTDIAVRTVAYIAEVMGLPGIGKEAGRLFTDKRLMRERLLQLGIQTLPNERTTKVSQAIKFLNNLDSAIIIKPLDSQGSRGVFMCKTEADVRDTYAEASYWSSDGSVLVEKCAMGPEFVVEGMALYNEFKNLCIGDTEYFDIPNVFAAKKRLFPTCTDEVLADRVLELNKRIVKGFGLRQGITHSEFIMDGSEIYLIETAARGGGVFISSDIINLCTGLDTEGFLLDLALGRRYALPDVDCDIQSCGYMAFYIPDGVITEISGIEEIKALNYVHRNQLSELYVGKVISGGQKDKTTRFAIVMSASSRMELEDRMAHVRRALTIVSRGEDGDRGIIWK